LSGCCVSSDRSSCFHICDDLPAKAVAQFQRCPERARVALVVILALEEIPMKYICTVCSWIYDPAKGDPDGGIAPGTQFADIPDTWSCPECGVSKEDFEPYNG